MYKQENGMRKCQTISNSQKALKTIVIIYKSKEKYNSQNINLEFLLPV